MMSPYDLWNVKVECTIARSRHWYVLRIQQCENREQQLQTLNRKFCVTLIDKVDPIVFL